MGIIPIAFKYADFDNDGDVDGADWAVLNANYTGAVCSQ